MRFTAAEEAGGHVEMTQPFAPEPRAISPFAIGGSFGAVHGVQAVGYPAVGEIDIRLEIGRAHV